MYTLENYYWGLVAYYVGALLIMIPVWRFTRFVPWFPVRALLRIAVIAILLTPMIVYREMDFLAPAWGVAVFEMIYPQTEEGWQRGIDPIVVTGCVSYALILAIWLLIRRWRNNKALSAEQSTEQPEEQSGKQAAQATRQEPTLSEIMESQP